MHLFTLTNLIVFSLPHFALSGPAPDTTKLIYPIATFANPPEPTQFTLTQGALMYRQDSGTTSSTSASVSTFAYITNPYSTDDFGLPTPLNSAQIASLSSIQSRIDASFTSAESAISSYLSCVSTASTEADHGISRCDVKPTATKTGKKNEGEKSGRTGQGWLVGGVVALLAL